MAWSTVGNFWHIIVRNKTVNCVFNVAMDGSQFLDAGKFSFAALTIALLLFSVLSTHKNTYKRFDNINNNSERFTLRNLLFSEAKVKSYIISHSLQNKGTS